LSQFNSFGKAIRQFRNEQKLPLRTVAAYLDIDQAILSKIESGHKKAPRALVSKLARYYHQTEDELIALWLSDQILYIVGQESLGSQALVLAEEQLAYQSVPVTQKNIISKIQSVLRNDIRIEKAWLFGSFARNEQLPGSDIDLMVRFHKTRKISLFDLADISNRLEQSVGIRVDLVEEESIREEITGDVNQGKILIYG